MTTLVESNYTRQNRMRLRTYIEVKRKLILQSLKIKSHLIVYSHSTDQTLMIRVSKIKMMSFITKSGEVKRETLSLNQ